MLSVPLNLLHKPLCFNLAQSTAAKFHELYRQALNPFLCSWSSTVIQADAIKKCLFMRLLTSKTFHQTNCASVTRLAPFLHVSAILFPPKLFSTKSVLATGSFICQNWINIVDGTNIVNLPEEWHWLNSISADNTRGKALGDSATLLKVFCSGEVIGLDKRVMQSLPSLMPKCPSNLWVEFFLQLLFPSSDTYWLILWILLGNYFSIDSGVINVRYLDSQTHDFSFFMTHSFCQSHFIKDFTVYVPTLTLSSDFLLTRCSECILC